MCAVGFSFIIKRQQPSLSLSVYPLDEFADKTRDFLKVLHDDGGFVCVCWAICFCVIIFFEKGIITGQDRGLETRKKNTWRFFHFTGKESATDNWWLRQMQKAFFFIIVSTSPKSCAAAAAAVENDYI